MPFQSIERGKTWIPSHLNFQRLTAPFMIHLIHVSDTCPAKIYEHIGGHNGGTTNPSLSFFEFSLCWFLLRVWLLMPSATSSSPKWAMSVAIGQPCGRCRFIRSSQWGHHHAIPMRAPPWRKSNPNEVTTMKEKLLYRYNTASNSETYMPSSKDPSWCSLLRDVGWWWGCQLQMLDRRLFPAPKPVAQLPWPSHMPRWHYCSLNYGISFWYSLDEAISTGTERQKGSGPTIWETIREAPLMQVPMLHRDLKDLGFVETA